MFQNENILETIFFYWSGNFVNFEPMMTWLTWAYNICPDELYKNTPPKIENVIPQKIAKNNRINIDIDYLYLYGVHVHSKY